MFLDGLFAEKITDGWLKKFEVTAAAAYSLDVNKKKLASAVQAVPNVAEPVSLWVPRVKVGGLIRPHRGHERCVCDRMRVLAGRGGVSILQRIEDVRALNAGVRGRKRARDGYAVCLTYVENAPRRGSTPATRRRRAPASPF